jgi:hypothetical protein
MGFVQIIRMKTSRPDELERIHETWRAATEGVRTVSRELVTKDRNANDVYWIIVEFPDHDAAMRNNELAATHEIAAAMAALAEEPLQFLDLDVLRIDV